MDWFFWAICCAFSLASADALTKKFLADYTVRELVVVRFGFTGLVLAPCLLVLPLPAASPELWGWIAVLMPLEVVAMLLYMRAIRDSSLASTLPYLAFTPVLTTLTGFLLLGEQISLKGLAGILLVVVGAYLLNLELVQSQARRAWLDPFRTIVRESGSRFMLGVAAIYSLTSVIGKIALQYVPPLTFGPFYFLLLGVFTLALFSVKQPDIVRVMWRKPHWHLLVGLMMGSMVVTHFIAIAKVEVAYMITVKRTSLLFGILYGALLFGEKRLGQHLLAGTLMIAGVALVGRV
jgi:drug/metabolite transporter (DMT)-like permease